METSPTPITETEKGGVHSLLQLLETFGNLLLREHGDRALYGGKSDIALTELKGGFLLRAFTARGREALAALVGREPTEEDYEEERSVRRRSEGS